MGLISNGTTLLDAGAINDGIATGNMILIKTLTASNSATLSFVHGASSVVLDGTYKSYVFKCINIHPIDDNVSFQINFRDGGTAYDATKQLFEPASTTFVKHFLARSTDYGQDNSIGDRYIAGYCNVTAAIDGVQFSFTGGNIDTGTIKMYGIL